jgi:hypothetical protein
MVVARPLRDHARPSLVEPRITTILDDLEAKAVPFGFVQPIVARGRTAAEGGRTNARRDTAQSWPI